MYSDKWEHDPPLQVFMWSTYALYQVYTLIAENNMNRIYFLQKLSNIRWYLYLLLIHSQTSQGQGEGHTHHLVGRSSDFCPVNVQDTNM